MIDSPLIAQPRHASRVLEEHARAPCSRLRLLFEIFFVIHWHDPNGLTRGCVSPCSRVDRGSVTDLGEYKQGLELDSYIIIYNVDVII